MKTTLGTVNPEFITLIAADGYPIAATRFNARDRLSGRLVVAGATGVPHYFSDDPRMPHIAEKYARVRTPIFAANALDDRLALPRSRDAFMRAYRNAPVERIDLDPDRYSGGIGHMGYFRQKSQPLWDAVLKWFQQPQCCNDVA